MRDAALIESNDEAGNHSQESHSKADARGDGVRVLFPRVVESIVVCKVVFNLLLAAADPGAPRNEQEDASGDRRTECNELLAAAVLPAIHIVGAHEGEDRTDNDGNDGESDEGNDCIPRFGAIIAIGRSAIVAVIIFGFDVLGFTA
eukprot:CAMPEP_0167820084 /NCGR_PEP_ID=MMETSP0112_2-20121227/5857_1 /TAXON_ID=91324 /ORGANISM="Lotharella globosa, Strain CCCM811" /LENGTH=145 /DNA_ID=CAMNT_0007720527 /DNA_START=161 /DNA_END=598 /DNA_ORIENTATION=-